MEYVTEAGTFTSLRDGTRAALKYIGSNGLPANLLSTLFFVEPVLDRKTKQVSGFRVYGAGFGHGVGMGQTRAVGMAEGPFLPGDPDALRMGASSSPAGTSGGFRAGKAAPGAGRFPMDFIPNWGGGMASSRPSPLGARGNGLTVPEPGSTIGRHSRTWIQPRFTRVPTRGSRIAYGSP
ncbi:MAG: hypothetical protein NUW01_10290 [Gemmatimonadaceae bacterium]|nr:hypothetical protein [Gemmatimonadaceae bacterium]